MSDVSTSNRVEPALGSEPATTPVQPVGAASSSSSSAARSVTGDRLLDRGSDRAPAGQNLDQLSRVEDKAARIEEKFARIENLMHKVESAALGLSDVARRTDMEKLSGRVGRLPGFSGLVVTAIITSLLTAALTVAIIRYMPGLITP